MNNESPLAPTGMRAGLDPPPACFPISNGSGSNQFMPPMSASYSKLETALPPQPPPHPVRPVHADYMQVRRILHPVFAS
ncbi:hypothetical protein NQ317_002907 [Molorchus minor]|uniref:Uncharacterized protein n=1 Tax=Molorchus minor TaxID=1323400 RepID=A0ABQ9JJZ4_9CUCU|nr:hypothetical protein NQ317_002907 [Molorchus minor]